MRVVFSENSWDDYTSWQNDPKKLKRINEVIKDIKRNPFEGIGKPEPLKYEYQGFWSRRIDSANRIIYQISNDELLIITCKYHYDD